jgi:hypothetical protein
MISKEAMCDELQKIGSEYHGFQLASLTQPVSGPKSSRSGVGVPGGGFEPTRGGFLLASGVQGQKVAEKVRAMNGDHLQHILDKERGDGVGKEKDSDGEFYQYSPNDFKRAKLAALGGSHIGKVPNQFGSKGPSIQQVAKPMGFGRAGAVAGTDKAGRI